MKQMRNNNNSNMKKIISQNQVIHLFNKIKSKMISYKLIKLNTIKMIKLKNKQIYKDRSSLIN